MSEELQLDRLASLRGEDKTSSIQIGVFRGNASIAVFQGEGKGPPPLKIPLGPRTSQTVIPHLLRQVAAGDPEVRKEITFTSWNSEAKKSEHLATMVLAKDEQNRAFMGISAPTKLSAPVKAFIRISLGYDLTSMSQPEQTKLAIEGMIRLFERDVPQAMTLTSFKRQPPGQRQQQQSSSSSGGDSIPF